MSTDPAPQPSVPRVIIRYANQTGALVIVREHQAYRNAYDMPIRLFDAECTGCLEDNGALPATAPRTAREWAAKHSAACRALPQPDTADQSGGTE